MIFESMRAVLPIASQARMHDLDATHPTYNPGHVQVREAKEEGGGDVAPIPVTVRQLEALVRISESLARMELATVVQEAHVLAAISLFHASTLDAVRSGASQAVNLSDEQARPLTS